MQDKIFCVREFIKTELATAVQRAFRLRFNIHPPTRNSIYRWNHQFEQISCLCKGKSSGRPRVSEENVRRGCIVAICSQLTLLHGCALGERSSGGIWKFRTSSFKCYVNHSYTMYSSGNIDVRNWVHLFESPCILQMSWGVYRSIRAYCKTEGCIGSIHERFNPSNDDSLEAGCTV